MNPPKIFISATSGDLSSARQIAKEALLTINCHPVEQTNFEPDWRSVTDMLRGKIGDCQALIHLVSFRYGAEPDPASLPGGTPRRSYTQMEYHLARELGLRVYTFLLPETYPFDVAAKPDSPEQTQLQAAHRALIQSSPHLYEMPGNDLDLRTRIIALQEKVIHLEQEQQSIAMEVKTTRHWGFWAAASILLILGSIGIWQWHGQSQLASQVQIVTEKQDEQTDLLKDHSNLLREAVVQLTQLTEEKARLGIKITDLPREAVEKELAARVGISAVELRLNIEAGKKSQDALTRAHANLLAGKLEDAHAAADEVLAAESVAIQRIIQANKVHGQAYFQEVKYESAIAAYHKAAALVDEASDPMELANLNHEIALIYLNLDRYKEAEPLIRNSLQIVEQHNGLEHPFVATCLNSLAGLLVATNRIGDAESLIRRALKIDEASLGKNHPSVARDIGNLAHLLSYTNRKGEAESLLRRALEIDEVNCGPTHPTVAMRMTNLGIFLAETKRTREAETLLLQAVQIYESNIELHFPGLAASINGLAMLNCENHRYEEAESMYRRAIKISETSYGTCHHTVALGLNNLAVLLKKTARFEDAELTYHRALSIQEQLYGPDHPEVAITLRNLAILLKATNRFEEAEPLARRALAICVAFQNSTGREHEDFLISLSGFTNLLKTLKLTDEQISAKIRDVLGPDLAATILGTNFQVTVTEIQKGGQAEAIGLKSGDSYATYNGQAITSVDQLIRLTNESKGEQIPLEVLRDGKKLNFTAKPGKLGTRIENRQIPATTRAETVK